MVGAGAAAGATTLGAGGLDGGTVIGAGGGQSCGQMALDSPNSDSHIPLPQMY